MRADEEVGVCRLSPLAGRVEDELEPPAKALEDKPSQHFRVAARMPDARRAARWMMEAQPQKIAEASPAMPSGPVEAEPDAVRQRCAISGAIVRLTAVPPE